MDSLLEALDALYQDLNDPTSHQEKRLLNHIQSILHQVQATPDLWYTYPLLPFQDPVQGTSWYEMFVHKVHHLDPLETYLPKERMAIAADIARFLLIPGVAEALLSHWSQSL